MNNLNVNMQHPRYFTERHVRPEVNLLGLGIGY